MLLRILFPLLRLRFFGKIDIIILLLPMKHVYDFEEGDKSMLDLLGGKGANLAEMTKLAFPVPFGFTITTETCNAYLDNNNSFPDGLEDEVLTAIKRLEEKTGKGFGDIENPLLVSVRSGARISMPGMMDTVLNLGLNAKTVEGLAAKTGDARFAYDSYRRFLQMFGDVVLGVDHEQFESVITIRKQQKGVENDVQLEAEDWREVAEQFRAIIEKDTGEPFPEEPYDQLKKAISAVFGSWNLPRAKKYREIHHIAHDLGTAVNVQMMVFGNSGDQSGTGVLFTRDPANGEKKLFGDFLLNAQGEDVVAGIRTPREISELEGEMPAVYAELLSLQDKLEQHYREMQDIEFTIEDEQLFLLQTRSGKRTAAAAVKIAVDMVEEGIITKEEAITRLNAKSLDTLLHPSLDPKAEKKVLGKGIAASPGAASGKAVFTADDAVMKTEQGEEVILVRHETSPEDIHGMHVSNGILTACGGKASHAAVVARGMGIPCVSGATHIIVNAKAKKCTIGDVVIGEGEMITIDGTTGEIMEGKVATIPAELSEDFRKILSWADEIRTLQVRANADTPFDANNAKSFGAEGIGLCRTEHMFFEEDRIRIVRQMILSESNEERQRAIDKLLPFQQKDFEEIFTEMDGLPITIRLLDPPLHEFLPKKNKEIEELAEDFGRSFEKIKDRIKYLSETNPMLGYRGCRLLISFSEILEMQARAIFRAASSVIAKGIKVQPEIMLPLIGTKKELAFCRKTIEKVAAEEQVDFPYMIGTMIELPRACARAEAIAEEADFFSFGTNDLTQMTFGFSRDDVGHFLPLYLEKGIIDHDPFERIDEAGVGTLIEMGVQKGRAVKPNLKISVCGEHGGDPASVAFFHNQGFTTVSCSPFRVPIARLAAAQAVLRK